MFNIEEYDKKIDCFNTLYNIALWDNDFISPCLDNVAKNEVIEELIQFKHKYILEMFGCIPSENTQIYKLLKKDYEYSFGIPVNLEKKVERALNECVEAYRKAKESSNYDMVRSQFANLVELKREEIDSLKISGKDTYSKLLDYSCGNYFSTFVNEIMEIITTELKEVSPEMTRKAVGSENGGNLSISDYEQLFKKYGVKSEYVIFQEDSSNSCLQLRRDDCRITIDANAKYNVARHEIGHILYMQNISPNLKYKAYNKPLSQVFDEAIAMLYELMIDGLDGLMRDGLYKSPIRIECTNIYRLLHIVVRYELERKLLNGEIDATEVDHEWKKCFKKHFGYEIKDDVEGVLQDPHWFSGMFGYFPVYNLAFALALVIYNRLEFEAKTYSEIFMDLKKYIWQYGASKPEEEILKMLGIHDFAKDFKDGFHELVSSKTKE